MDRLWLRHYPPGVPSEIDVARYPSLVTMFEESFTDIRQTVKPAPAWASP